MAKKEKIQYPNPEFFRCKDEINWKAQWENLKEVGAIAWDMLKATDWKKFGLDRVEDAKADGKRVKEEGLDNDLIDRIAADPMFGLTKEEIVAELDSKAYIGRAPQQVEDFIANDVMPRIRPYLDDEELKVEINL